MTEYVSTLESRVEYYNQPALVNNPNHPAGFKGTFAFSDHSLIPEVFTGFLQRQFGSMRIRRIPLKDINALLNELWEGPGSLEKIFRLEEDLQIAGKEIRFTSADIAAIKVKPDDDEDNGTLHELPLSSWGAEDDDDE